MPPSKSKGKDGDVIRLVRPLRDVGVKECGTYAWWRRLKVVGKEKWPGGKQGIPGLTKGNGRLQTPRSLFFFTGVSEFILGLENDYPSTVSTITRTCAKLVPKDEPAGTCSICQRFAVVPLRVFLVYDVDGRRPVQAGLDRWKSQISIRSLAEANSSLPLGQGPPPNSLAPSLCYSCQGTLTSRSSKSGPATDGGAVISLPVWTQAKLVDRGEMKGEIREFLLSEDEDG